MHLTRAENRRGQRAEIEALNHVIKERDLTIRILRDDIRILKKRNACLESQVDREDQ